VVSTAGCGAASVAPAYLWRWNMRTYIYIDGFNFYYGAVKDTPYKWLDFKLLFQHLLNPAHEIQSIKYFTAIVTGKIDPDAPVRQKTYLRAIQKYIPEISIHYGVFLSHNKCMPLAYPIEKKCFGRKIKFANIIKTEEKGSDVRLAVHVLNDAWLDLYDCAVIVSNDSDLSESLKIVKTHHRKEIGLLTPWKYSPSRDLIVHADFKKRIRKGALSASQLPNPIPGTSIHKPLSW
jgi:uncharacterized LabA/DUF88 family protein